MRNQFTKPSVILTSLVTTSLVFSSMSIALPRRADALIVGLAIGAAPTAIAGGALIALGASSIVAGIASRGAGIYIPALLIYPGLGALGLGLILDAKSKSITLEPWSPALAARAGFTEAESLAYHRNAAFLSRSLTEQLRAPATATSSDIAERLKPAMSSLPSDAKSAFKKYFIAQAKQAADATASASGSIEDASGVKASPTDSSFASSSATQTGSQQRKAD